MSREKITISEQRPARAVAGDINRRLLPGFLAEWQEEETSRQARAAEMERYRYQVDLLRRFVPEFRPLYGSKELRGDDAFSVPHGTLRLYAGDHKATLTLSLSYDDLVKVLLLLSGKAEGNGE